MPPLVAVPASDVVLLDEGTRRTWTVEVAACRLAAWPVTGELWHAVRAAGPGTGFDAGVGRTLGATAGPGPGSAGSRVPVTDVSWLDAVRFCNALSRLTGCAPAYTIGTDRDALDVEWDRDADGYRLPTEAEWEHACRAGSTDVRHGELDVIAWHRGNSGGAAHDVARKAANAWGLHDMIGNVWEWCWDLFDPRVYGPYRVFRGGGWNDVPRSLRASCRRKSHPTFAIDDLGVRLARSA